MHHTLATLGTVTRQGVKYGIAIGAIWFLIAQDRLRLSDLQLTFARFDIVLATAGLLLAARLLSFYRHWLLLRAANVELSLGTTIRIGFIGCFFSSVLFGVAGGDLIKSGYLFSQTRNRSGALSSVIVDRFMGVFSIILLGGIALLWIWPQVLSTPQLHSLALVTAAVFGGATVLLLLGCLALVGGRGVALACWLLLAGLSTGMLARQLHAIDGGPARQLIYQLLAITLLHALLGLLIIGILPALLPGGRCENWFSNHIRGGQTLMNGLQSFLDYRTHLPLLGAAIVLSVATHLCTLIVLYLYSRPLQLQPLPGFGQVLLAGPPALTVASLPFPASGLGVAEAVFDQVLRISSASIQTTIQGGATLFLVTRVWGIVINLAGLPLYLQRRPAANETTPHVPGGTP